LVGSSNSQTEDGEVEVAVERVEVEAVVEKDGESCT